MANEQTVTRWTDAARKKLQGRQIVDVGYLTEDARKSLMWDAACIVLILDDGSYLLPSRDDEGNGPGALFTGYDDLPTIPTL